MKEHKRSVMTVRCGSAPTECNAGIADKTVDKRMSGRKWKIRRMKMERNGTDKGGMDKKKSNKATKEGRTDARSFTGRCTKERQADIKESSVKKYT